MSDTNILQFSLRERVWMSTKRFTQSLDEPGQLLRIVCDPIGAVISEGSYDQHGAAHYASPLALTLSRFRDFKYIGTKLSLVPCATTGQIDPAHISTAAGVNNYMHPRDVGNMIHWRRWVGGQIRVPSVLPSGPEDPVYLQHAYTEFDSYDLDAAWLSDTRFNHAMVSDGFTLFAKPLRANLQASAATTVSLFGYRDSDNMTLAAPALPAEIPNGFLSVTAGDVVPDSWVPNPFAGFKYKNLPSADVDTGNEILVVSGFNDTYPWFSDVPKIMNSMGIDTATLYKMVRARFLAPVCILRLPPAYGSVYYWTLYMRHYFAVRRPYITNGTYVASIIKRFEPSPLEHASSLRLMVPAEDSADDYRVVQMVGPDPYVGQDGVASLQLYDEGDVPSIWCMSSAPDEKDPEKDGSDDLEKDPEKDLEKDLEKEDLEDVSD